MPDQLYRKPSEILPEGIAGVLAQLGLLRKPPSDPPMPRTAPPDISGIEQELFDSLGGMVNEPEFRVAMGYDNPTAVAPPQKVPTNMSVTGSPMLAKLVEHYKTRLPWLGKYVPRVSESVTPAAASMVEEAGIPWQRFPDTNLMGVYDIPTKEIGINPRAGADRMEAVLAHEIAHALGERGHSRNLYNIQGLAQMRADALEMGGSEDGVKFPRRRRGLR